MPDRPTVPQRCDVYVGITQNRIVSTVDFPVGEGGISVDLDEDGRPVGVEIIEAVDVSINGAGMVDRVAKAIHEVTCDCGVPSTADYAYAWAALAAFQEPS